MAKDDDDLLPLKKKPVSTKSKAKAKASSSAAGPSAPMLRIMRITRAIGILLGGFITLVGMMSIVGLVTDNFLARLIVGLVVVLGVPALAADRMLKRSAGGGIAMVVDVFAIVLLGIALVVAGVDVVSEPLLRREGDRYAKSGSIFMARVVYYLAGRSPIFPHERPAGAKPAGSSAAPPASGAK